MYTATFNAHVQNVVFLFLYQVMCVQGDVGNIQLTVTIKAVKNTKIR